MAWRIELSATAERQLSKIGKPEAKRIVAYLRERIDTNNPRRSGKPLHGAKFKDLWRYRVGDHRIVCQLQNDRLVVLVVEIGHRREVYRG